jgi:hypothetical protein
VKRTLITLATAAALLASRPASAQVYGQYTGAECVPLGGHLFGAYLHASRDFFGLLTQLRLSFYPNVDFGFQGGLTRISLRGGDVTTLRVGSDIKFKVVHARQVDLSLGGALSVETGDHLHLLTLGPTAVASRTFGGSSGAGITPYAGVGLLFTNAELETREFTDFSMPFRLGAELRLAPEVRLVAEVQLRASDEINNDIGFTTGVNLPF